MFLKAQLSWDVIIHPENMDSKGITLQRSIMAKLLDIFAAKKATKELGFLISVTMIDRIGQGIIRQRSGELLFRVDFSCLTFKILPGEVLEGVVHKVQKHGAFLRFFSIEKLYLSNRKMGGFRFVADETIFVNEKSEKKIEVGVVLRFVAVAVEYDAAEEEFRALVSIEASRGNARMTWRIIKRSIGLKGAAEMNRSTCYIHDLQLIKGSFLSSTKHLSELISSCRVKTTV